MSSIPHIVYGVDAKYVPPLLVSAYSAFAATPGPVKLTIVTTDPKCKELAHVRTLTANFPQKSAKVLYFDPDLLHEYDAERSHYWTAASMIPLFVPWIVEGKCILLDADTIILRDIGELYESDLKGLPIGAVQSITTALSVKKNTSFGLNSIIVPGRARRRKREICDWAGRVGFTIKELQEMYFAGGVILLDNDAIRLTDPQRELSDLSASRVHWNSMPDMDRYNEFFKGRCHLLDLKWNVYRDFLSLNRMHCRTELWARIKRARKDPGILHYPNMFGRKVWRRPWFKTRNRHRIYAATCHRMREQTGIPIFDLLEPK